MNGASSRWCTTTAATAATTATSNPGCWRSYCLFNTLSWRRRRTPRLFLFRFFLSTVFPPWVWCMTRKNADEERPAGNLWRITFSWSNGSPLQYEYESTGVINGLVSRHAIYSHFIHWAHKPHCLFVTLWMLTFGASNLFISLLSTGLCYRGLFIIPLCFHSGVASGQLWINKVFIFLLSMNSIIYSSSGIEIAHKLHKVQAGSRPPLG